MPVESIASPKVVEVALPGFTTRIREISSYGADTDRINNINNSLTNEFYEIGPENPEDTIAWLRGGVTRRFNSITPGSPKRIALGVDTGEQIPTDEVVIGTIDPDSSDLAGYVYYYKSDEFSRLPQQLQEKYRAQVVKDVSYVTATEDGNRNPTDIAQGILLSAQTMYERLLGRNVENFKGELTKNEIPDARTKMILFASAGAGDNEINYRKGLEQAGFHQVHHYSEEGEEFISYVLEPEQLMQKVTEFNNRVQNPK